MSQVLADRAAFAARPDDVQPVRIVTVALAAVVLPLLVQYGMTIAIGGSLFRVVSPLYVLVFGLLYAQYWRPLFPIFAIAAFVYAPFLRRMADNSGGFVSFNLALVAPYFGLLPTVPALVRRVLGQRPGPVWPFATLLAVIVYGIYAALVNEAEPLVALYEAGRWMLPIALCAFIMDEPGQSEAIRRRLVVGIALILPILTVYGVYQYIVAPPWDVFWMVNVDNVTFGDPEPFKIRVFSMLNSPFSAAAFATMAMVLLGADSVISLVIAGMGTALLALSLVRTAWLGLAVGVAWVLLTGTSSRRFLLTVGAIIFGFLTTMVIAVPVIAPDVAQSINARFSTLQNLQTDSSANVRLDFYGGFYTQLDAYPLGEGFGASQSFATQNDRRATQPLDSGILEALLVFGVAVATVYFIAVGALVRRALRVSRLAPKELSGCMAIVITVLVMSFLGSYQQGEIGAFAWAALGIVLARELVNEPGDFGKPEA
jgi:putative inorganic carbon (HCO3(-)) transporter